MEESFIILQYSVNKIVKHASIKKTNQQNQI